MENIAVVGIGYVGLVTGACLADTGNSVICVDKNLTKVKELRDGTIPIYEPGLNSIIARCSRTGQLCFTNDIAEAVAHSKVIFVAVGTPSRSDGSADLSQVFEVTEKIADLINGHRIVVMKSTVPVGTCRKITSAIATRTPQRFDYVSNPEFLREGSAVDDFVRPNRIVLGSDDPAIQGIMREIYAPFVHSNDQILFMDPESAEMTKYASNALLANKISFMNEISGLCEILGADVEKVRTGVGMDMRIGPAFLSAGIGYGGSCFPKDIAALKCMGQTAGYPMEIVTAIHQVNERQRAVFGTKIIDYFGCDCSDTTVAVWGLAFKANTDDVRESPAITVVNMMLKNGITVHVHDPYAMSKAVPELNKGHVLAFKDKYEALRDADGLAVLTEWPQFQSPNFARMKQELKKPVIFDGRNLYDPNCLAKHGFHYISIGRPEIIPKLQTQAVQPIIN